MRNRFNTTSTGKAEIVYSYTEKNWIKCPHCGQKLLEVIESKGSIAEIKCRRCGSIEKVEI
ncbi:hypothetical protein KL86DYS1_10477 [uncultured Dysgonomonas sp.]|uniref:Mu-like prophage protein Com n=1 Tax=uncultured Dysgonomonas sp. TaxID=206096 RepID=A0A212IXK5_9BACT|nr:hypothetical protein KL86DYS1_10477 [uncultured Dysgonomonas sp.]